MYIFCCLRLIKAGRLYAGKYGNLSYPRNTDVCVKHVGPFYPFLHSAIHSITDYRLIALRQIDLRKFK